MEQIYTIPVNEAFDASAADHACGCPMCALYNRLEENELDLILGASMMEPDVRQKTNELGFCHRHYGMMFTRKNRLGLGLILESHFEKVKRDLSGEGLGALFGGAGNDAIKKLGKLEESCYVCGRIETNLSRMFDTVLLLYRQDSAFRRKLAAQPYFCLPHYRRLLTLAKTSMSKKEFAEFYATISELEQRYAETLSGDVSWFCKKFDYRYQDEPWNNAKDAVERSIRFLSGNEGGGPAGGERK
ncbi:MAG: hypothetical protein IJY20_01900 [Clostridia bacterium]|nr:hypothetical protein [Clostridia bacterium]